MRVCLVDCSCSATVRCLRWSGEYALYILPVLRNLRARTGRTDVEVTVCVGKGGVNYVAVCVSGVFDENSWLWGTPSFGKPQCGRSTIARRCHRG